jgi:hypothetical protein
LSAASEKETDTSEKSDLPSPWPSEKSEKSGLPSPWPGKKIRKIRSSIAMPKQKHEEKQAFSQKRDGDIPYPEKEVRGYG